MWIMGFEPKIKLTLFGYIMLKKRLNRRKPAEVISCIFNYFWQFQWENNIFHNINSSLYVWYLIKEESYNYNYLLLHECSRLLFIVYSGEKEKNLIECSLSLSLIIIIIMNDLNIVILQNLTFMILTWLLSFSKITNHVIHNYPN